MSVCVFILILFVYAFKAPSNPCIDIGWIQIDIKSGYPVKRDKPGTITSSCRAVDWSLASAKEDFSSGLPGLHVKVTSARETTDFLPCCKFVVSHRELQIRENACSSKWPQKQDVHHPHDAVKQEIPVSLGWCDKRSLKAKLEPTICSFAESGFRTLFITWKIEK